MFSVVDSRLRFRSSVVVSECRREKYDIYWLHAFSKA